MAEDDQAHAARINEIRACSKVKCQRIHRLCGWRTQVAAEERDAGDTLILCPHRGAQWASLTDLSERFPRLITAESGAAPICLAVQITSNLVRKLTNPFGVLLRLAQKIFVAHDQLEAPFFVGSSP
jgi:hypothetical protein